MRERVAGSQSKGCTGACMRRHGENASSRTPRTGVPCPSARPETKAKDALDIKRIYKNGRAKMDAKERKRPALSIQVYPPVYPHTSADVYMYRSNTTRHEHAIRSIRPRSSSQRGRERRLSLSSLHLPHRTAKRSIRIVRSISISARASASSASASTLTQPSASFNFLPSTISHIPYPESSPDPDPDRPFLYIKGPPSDPPAIKRPGRSPPLVRLCC
jgi:hypothetical protein